MKKAYALYKNPAMNGKNKETTVLDYGMALFLVVISIFAPSALGAMRPWSGALLRMMGAVLAVIFGISVFGKNKFFLNRLDLIAIISLSYCLVRVFFSPVKYYAAGEFLNILNYFFLFFVSSRVFAGKKSVNIYIAGLLLSVLFVASYGLIDYFKGANSVFGILRPVQYHGRLGGTYICPNHCSGFFEITFFVLLACLFVRKINSGYKIIIGYILALVILSVLLSKSRSGIACMLVGLTVFAILASREKKRYFLIGLSIVLAAVIISGTLFLPEIAERFSRFSSDTSINTRITIWKDTLALVKQKPLLGFGLGSYKWVYHSVRSAGMSREIDFAHNDYLHAWVETGILGLALVLWFVFSYFKLGIRAIGLMRSSTKRFILYGIFSGIAAIMAHSLTDFNMHILANASVLIILAGMGSGIMFSSVDLEKTLTVSVKPVFAGTVFSLLGMLVCVFSFLDFRTALIELKAAEFLKEGAFDSAAACYEKSLLNYRINPDIYKSAGRVYKTLYKFRQNSEFREKAIEMFEKGKKANHLEGDFNIELGLICQSGKNFKEAESEFLQALEKDPNNAYYNNVIGTYYYIINDNDKAEKYFKNASEMNFRNDYAKHYLKLIRKRVEK
ncbi:MAG: O-antigen ligase family protein [bacterium]|nr:O-antigen ligase family protein [bacterium]